MSFFSPLLGIYDLEVKDFIFSPYYPNPGVRHGKDENITHTIKALLLNYCFIEPTRVLVYSCDSSDKRESARQRLFEQWINQLDGFLIRHEIELDIETENGIETTYGGVIVRIDFPENHILVTELIEKVPGVIMEKYGL